MASKHDLSTIFIVIISLIDELCFSDDHVSVLTRIHHYGKYDWLRQVDGQVIGLTFI